MISSPDPFPGETVSSRKLTYHRLSRVETMDLMHRRRTKTQAAGHGFFLALEFSPSWISHLWLNLTMDPLSQRYGVRMSQAQG